MLPPDIGKVEFGLKRTGLGDNDLKIGGHATPEKHRGIGNSMMKGCNPFFSNNFLCFYLFELNMGFARRPMFFALDDPPRERRLSVARLSMGADGFWKLPEAVSLPLKI